MKKGLTMNISEKDIFNFVFSPGKLSNEVKTYINNNIQDFEEEIHLFENIQSDLNRTVPDEIISQIEDRISNINGNKVIELYKTPTPAKTENRHLTLAAESEPGYNPNNISVDTFWDKNSNYMVKVINAAEEKKLIIFENGNSFIEDFTIKIYPSTKTFEHISNEEPVILDKNEKIEKIVITIH